MTNPITDLLNKGTRDDDTGTGDRPKTAGVSGQGDPEDGPEGPLSDDDVGDKPGSKVGLGGKE